MSDLYPPVLFDASGLPVQSTLAPATGRPGQALGNPQAGVLALGSDYATTPAARAPRVDATGLQYVVVTGADLAALPTFSCDVANVATAANKSMISLANAAGSAFSVRVVAMYCQSAGGTGLGETAAPFEIRRITGHSAGNLVAAVTHDTQDALPAAVTIRSGATVAGQQADAARRYTLISGALVAALVAGHSVDASLQALLPAYQRMDATAKNLTLRPGEGMTLVYLGAATNGNFDLGLTFTVASA